MKSKFILTCTLVILFTNLVSAQLKSVSYNDEDQKLTGFFAKPLKEKTKKPGILILPAWMGIDDHSKESAEALSKLGYYTFIADIYGDGNKPKNTTEASTQAGFYKKNIKNYQKRIQLALDELVKNGANADEIVVIGYCFGGTGAIEAARTNMNVKGVISFHGGLGRDDARIIEPIKPKVLVLHGADDTYVPDAEIKAFQNEMRTASADWQMVYYANSVHAFTEKTAGNDNSKGVAYNEKAAKRSWKAMLTFLEEIL